MLLQTVYSKYFISQKRNKIVGIEIWANKKL